MPPVCHQDDVLKTSIQPSDPPFEYRFRIPTNEPPGLYWYHPHIHGFTRQVLGGASGAMIVEGIERANPALAGLPERVLVIRDQDLLNPNAPPSKSEPVVPKLFIDRDGDAANNGTGFGKPAKDLSVNFVPVPYPDYPPARITMRPGERQLWRVLNASAITYLNLAVLYHRAPQPLGIVAIDGVPMRWGGGPAPPIDWVDHIGLPPARAWSSSWGPPPACRDCWSRAPWTPGRAGKTIPTARSPRSLQPATRPSRAPAAALRAAAACRGPWLGDVPPVRVRKLYFSEKLQDPNDPNSATSSISRWMARRRAIRSELRHAQHRRPPGRCRRLDHRESIHGVARLSHPSNAFHAAWTGPACR